MIRVDRNFVAFWLLGLCNNYGYVVMLSAAHDILAKQNNSTDSSSDQFNPDRHCNVLSTGVILLADVIPSLIIKTLAPFTPLFMNARMGLVVVIAALGFIVVGLAGSSLTLAVIGVGCTSFASGLGESTLISFTVFFKSDQKVLTAWSSGTGGAGFFGSMTYAALIGIGLSPKETLFLLLIVPVVMGVSFWIVLENPLRVPLDEEAVKAAASNAVQDDETIPINISTQSLSDRIGRIPMALQFIIPLGLVYYFEYLINQGLYELTTFNNTFIDIATQYRWYQVLYQIGVFISRSSLSLIEINKIGLLAFLQGVNLVYFSLEAIYKFTPSVIIVFVVILWEGLIGGLTYVNAFNKIQREIPPQDREIVTGISTIADSIGITLAGFSSIPVHNEICKLPNLYF